MDASTRQACGDTLPVSNANPGFMTGPERTEATPANVVPPRQWHGHPLTPTDPPKVVQKDGRHWIAQRTLLKALLQQVDRRRRGLMPPASTAPTASTSHAHSTPRAARMALEI